MCHGSRPTGEGFGAPWLALCAVFAFYIGDEALTGFLNLYHPQGCDATGLGMVSHAQVRVPGMAGRPDGGMHDPGLARAACIPPSAVAAADGLALRGRHVGERIGPHLFSRLGSVAATVRFPRPAPGFWSLPLLRSASVRMIV
jgi:hypothetical protein